MKIQRGIVKYKDRNDIVCTYALTDDGKQYYFLDENDAKKFSNGNRIATTALVEAVDPMVKAVNVGIIDENGVIVVPFENRSIRPVNDNIIVIEKANPTSQNVLDAIELRNDPASATQLVSTPATIKNNINTQMGVEGKYIFNDQFSEATICDINGTNLVNGESYSFISMANDKLYLAKNTVETPIAEFSLTTYELNANPEVNVPAEVNPEAIDVSNTQIDQQAVEDALASAAPVEGQEVAAEVPVEGQEVAAEVPVEGQEVAAEVPVEGQEVAAEVPVEGQEVAAEVPVEGQEVAAENMFSVNPTPIDASEVAAVTGGEGAMTGETVDFPVEGDVPPTDTVSEDFSAENESISDDLKAFTDGAPLDETQAETEAEVPVENEVTEPTSEEVSDENSVPPVVEEANNETAPEAEKVKEEIPEANNEKEEVEDETVFATVDKNQDGVIDKDEVMIPQEKVEAKEKSLLTDVFAEDKYEDVPRREFSFNRPSYASDYDSSYSDVKYDSFVDTGDNIMDDVARSMSDLMRQNKEQKSAIAQYQSKLDNLENQVRLLNDKCKDQSMRNDILTSKLRDSESDNSRLESRCQMLDSRVHDQERELKLLRSQVASKQDLVRLLADARNLLSTDSYGYNDDDNYYRRVA